ncbi:hypothetical protein KJ682_02775 [bacterium]|nr:hypothetical protein [bacterium]
MSNLDKAAKWVWLIVGVFILVWICTIRGPSEYRRWWAARQRAESPAPVRQEPGVIVGETASQDQIEGVKRQGIRFGTIVDPALVRGGLDSTAASMRENDWLLVPVQLVTYVTPQRFEIEGAEYMVEARAPDYEWKPNGNIAGHIRAGVGGINLVFCRRSGGESTVLLDRAAWISSVFLPDQPGGRLFYELAVVDTNGDDRVDSRDSLTLWASDADGSNLRQVWMPAGRVEPNRYSEPLSGDQVLSVTSDTNSDGVINEYDQPKLFRLSLGDTVATVLVSAESMAKLNSIAFGKTE